LRAARTENAYSDLKKDYTVKVNYSAAHAFYENLAGEK
jgi:hypothetical protein